VRPFVTDVIQSQPEFARWLPDIGRLIHDSEFGAQGIRALGRLMYEFHKSRIRDACLKAYGPLKWQERDPSWEIYIAAGVSGGTGSGITIPLAYDLADWSQASGLGRPAIHGFFALPSHDIKDRGDRYYPNAYAFLTELKHLAQADAQQFPFSTCSLVEPRDNRGYGIESNQLLTLIARRIVFGISGVVSDASFGAHLQEAARKDASDGAPFSSFGISDVSYPQRAVAQCVALLRAEAVVREWLRSSSGPVLKTVESDRYRLGLSVAHIWGDADSCGNWGFEQFESEIADNVDAALNTVAKRELGAKADSIRGAIENTYREVGIRAFYRTRIENVERSCARTAVLLRVQVSRLLAGTQGEACDVDDYLQCLASILEDEKQKVLSAIAEGQQDRLLNKLAELTDTVSHVRENEQRLIYTTKRFSKDRSEVGIRMKEHLSLLTARHAAEFAAIFVQGALETVKSLRADLRIWTTLMTKVALRLRAELGSFKDELSSSVREKILFDVASLDYLFQQRPNVPEMQTVGDGVRLQFGQDELDLLALSRHAAEVAASIVYRAAEKWTHSEDCLVDAHRKTFCGRLIELFPDPADRRNLFAQAQQLSEVMLRFSREEEDSGTARNSTGSVAVFPRSPDGYIEYCKSEEVRSDLTRGVACQPVKGDDSNRVIFLQEYHGIDLRDIALVGELKELYDRYPQKEVLHIDRLLVSEQVDPFRPTGRLQFYRSLYRQESSVPDRPESVKPAEDTPLEGTYGIPPGGVDRVHFQVVAPPTVRPGQAFCLGLWAYTEKQRSAVARRIRARAQRDEVLVGSKGPLRIARGTQMVAQVELEDCVIRDSFGVILWEGEIGNHDFPVRVPQGAPPGDRQGAVRISIEDLLVAVVHFTIAVGVASSQVTELSLETRRFSTAFASYASEDRPEVVRRVQGIEAASVQVWMDVISLRAGNDWAREIENKIGSTDIFYLFWSRHAAASEWVRKETQLALDRKGNEYVRPIPLETVHDVQPPTWLPNKHWNDILLYLLYAEESLRARGADQS
jgi:hypothetical protein